MNACKTIISKLLNPKFDENFFIRVERLSRLIDKSSPFRGIDTHLAFVRLQILFLRYRVFLSIRFTWWLTEFIFRNKSFTDLNASLTNLDKREFLFVYRVFCSLGEFTTAERLRRACITGSEVDCPYMLPSDLGVAFQILTRSTKFPESHSAVRYLSSINHPIVLIGPAHNLSSSSDNLTDGFTVFFNKPICLDSPTRRPCIVVMNDEQAASIESFNLKNVSHLVIFLKTLKYCSRIAKIFNVCMGSTLFILPPTRPLCPYGTFNLLPLFLLALCLSGHKKSLRIVGVDFMLTSRRYLGYYPSNWNRENDDHLKWLFRRGAALSHCPLTQYEWCLLLSSKLNITGDSRYLKALSLGSVEFVDRLTSIYSVAKAR